jgi:hypothetical protein
MQQHLNKTNNLAAQQGKSKLSSLVILLVLMVAVGGVFTNYNRIFDYIQLRNYQPPANIVQLADDTTMNAAARHLLYLNKPKLANIVADFRKHCPEMKILLCWAAITLPNAESLFTTCRMQSWQVFSR